MTPLLPSPPTAVLYVGVISFASPAALRRRNYFRVASAAHTARAYWARVQFVMAVNASSDSALPDVLILPVRRDDAIVGPYLLTCAFLRHALAQPVPFVARADDDAFFDAEAIAFRLQRVARPRVIFGAWGEWCMWDPASRTPACFSFSASRFLQARQAAASNASGTSLTADQRECLNPLLVGPFPYAKGPFVAYSRSVSAALLRDIDRRHDEEWAVGTVPTDAASYRRRFPSAPFPRLFDDLHFAFMTYRLFRSSGLTSVHATLSEHPHARLRASSNRSGAYAKAVVLHSLKKAPQWRMVQSAVVQVDRAVPAQLACSLWRKRPRHTALERHCCTSWEFCHDP